MMRAGTTGERPSPSGALPLPRAFADSSNLDARALELFRVLPAGEEAGELVRDRKSCRQEDDVGVLLGRVFGQSGHPAVLRQPGGGAGATGPALDDLLGDVGTTEILEVGQSEAVTELVVGPLGIDGIGERIGKDPTGVGRVEQQDAAVLHGVGPGGLPDVALAFALGRIGDDGRTPYVLALTNGGHGCLPDWSDSRGRVSGLNARRCRRDI